MVNLGILLSQCRWYDEIKDKNFVFKDEPSKNRKIEEINNLSDCEFKRHLLELAKNKDYVRSNVKPVPVGPKSKLDFSRLSSPRISINELKNFEQYGSEIIKNEGVTVRQRTESLRKVLTDITGHNKSHPGKISYSGWDLNLSKSQMGLYNKIFERIPKNHTRDVYKDDEGRLKYSTLQGLYDEIYNSY